MMQIAETTLQNLVALLPQGAQSKEAARIKHAYNFAKAAHGRHQCRDEYPCIEKASAVARILADLGVDVNTVIAGLLHMILEPHTQVKETAVFDNFGPDVGKLVVTLNNLYAYEQKDQYKLSQHPDVTSGRKSERDCFMECMGLWDTQDREGIVSWAEFEDYHRDFSCSVESDAEYESILQNVWKF